MDILLLFSPHFGILNAPLASNGRIIRHQQKKRSEVMDIWKELQDEGIDPSLLEEIQHFRAAHPVPPEAAARSTRQWR